jgi:hypothetical protein
LFSDVKVQSELKSLKSILLVGIRPRVSISSIDRLDHNRIYYNSFTFILPVEEIESVMTLREERRSRAFLFRATW